MPLLRTCAHVRGNKGGDRPRKPAKERTEAQEGHIDGARACWRSGRWGVEGGRETAIWAVGGGRHPGLPHSHKSTHGCAFARGGGSTPAILRRESLSFHLRAHAMRTMEGRGDNARWVECELGCENISAQPLHLHPPPPSSRAVYEAMQSTMC